jgi:signal transduction histidine kinase
LDEGDKSAVAQVVANLRSFAHDLNNSLAVLMGFAQLLILDANCQGNIRNDVEKLYSELKRVIQVVEKFHAYALSLYGLPKRDQVSGATLQQAPESKTCNLRYES